MDPRLAEAQAALSAGEWDRAADLLIALVEESPAQPRGVYAALVARLHEAGRNADADRYSQRAVEIHPSDAELWNSRGVILRRAGRRGEALEALDMALRLRADDRSAVYNRANVLLDLGRPAEAQPAFEKLLRDTPGSAALLRQLAVSLYLQGEEDGAAARLRQAVAADPGFVPAWQDLAQRLLLRGRADEACDICDEAVTANPGDQGLVRTQVVVLGAAGRLERLEGVLRALLARAPDTAWAQARLGGLLVERYSEEGVERLRRAVELEPEDLDHLFSLILGLTRMVTGDEGARLEEALTLARRAMAVGVTLRPDRLSVVHTLFRRLCAFEDAARLGSPREIGRSLAGAGLPGALMPLLSRVETHEDRIELVGQHRLWAATVEQRAAARPIRRPEPRPVGGKVRLGFLSSDLRQHPVGYFVQPLISHIDRERFEIFAYSFYPGEPDRLQQYVAEQVPDYRIWSDASPREAAQAIADDDLDMLIELGGHTRWSRVEVLAYRPAPRQASWLGYPHSVGLSAIDWFICDPHSAPADPELLVERPLLMPKSWLVLGRAAFSEIHVIEDGLPEERQGALTFGTANNPTKFNAATLAAWARVVAATPGSRFAIVRPECGAASFRGNVEAAFAAEGVASDRLLFHTQRGRHLPFYNGIDIALDPFPLTGGTSTAESLWMGVPVVSLVGEAFYERLSHSLLTNVGLSDLCAFNLADYHRIAVELAADRARRLDLRRTLRERVKQGPLGQTEQFAADFYDTIWNVVHAR